MDYKFRTEINLKNGEFPEISYQSLIFLIGSCFSDEIGNKFKSHKFHVISNPFGVSYNPISIENQLSRIVSKNYFKESDLFKKGAYYNSYELHGSFDNLSANELLNQTDSIIDDSHQFLKNCTHLYITLGTAWVYELVENERVVNNCHKQASRYFSKKLLTPEICLRTLDSIVLKVRELNPLVQIIFTISPVRHLKDGYAENNLSKSILRIALMELLELRTNCWYFPSYEIMMDDLRDYRFYKEDLIHPSEAAIDYIWNQLTNAQISLKNREIMDRVSKLNKALKHRPFAPDSSDYKQFLKKTLNEAIVLQKEISSEDLTKEIQLIQSELTAK